MVPPLSSTDIEVVRQYLSRTSRFRQYERLWESALDMLVNDLAVERPNAVGVLQELVKELAISRIEMDRFDQWAGYVLSR